MRSKVQIKLIYLWQLGLDPPWMISIRVRFFIIPALWSCSHARRNHWSSHCIHFELSGLEWAPPHSPPWRKLRLHPSRIFFHQWTRIYCYPRNDSQHQHEDHPVEQLQLLFFDTLSQQKHTSRLICNSHVCIVSNGVIGNWYTFASSVISDSNSNVINPLLVKHWPGSIQLNPFSREKIFI